MTDESIKPAAQNPPPPIFPFFFPPPLFDRAREIRRNEVWLFFRKADEDTRLRWMVSLHAFFVCRRAKGESFHYPCPNHSDGHIPRIRRSFLYHASGFLGTEFGEQPQFDSGKTSSGHDPSIRNTSDVESRTIPVVTFFFFFFGSRVLKARHFRPSPSRAGYSLILIFQVSNSYDLTFGSPGKKLDSN